MPPMPDAATALQIFKSGRHTDMHGRTFEFSDSDLRATAAAYDPSKHEAPLVVGHPKLDDPAHGWVQALTFAQGALLAEPIQVNPEFAQCVRDGAFKKMSASFYGPDSPANPVPGVYYLRHVGFLGATAPAVKGLRSASFADDEQGVVSFSEYDDVTNAALWRSLRDWFIGKFGQQEADTVLPGYQVHALEQGAVDEVREAQAEGTPAVAPAFAQSTHPKEKHVTEQQAAAVAAENANLKQQLQQAQDQIAQAHRAAVHAANLSFCESVGSNRLLPAHRELAVSVLDHLALADEPIQFGEGDARQDMLAAFKGFLQKLPAQVSMDDVATSRASGAASQGGPAFAAPAGFAVSPERQALHSKALAYQQEHKVDFIDAVRAVQSGV